MNMKKKSNDWMKPSCIAPIVKAMSSQGTNRQLASPHKQQFDTRAGRGRSLKY